VQTCVNKASSDWRRWVAITAAVSQIAFWSGGRSGARCWGPVPTKIWSSAVELWTFTAVDGWIHGFQEYSTWIENNDVYQS
jgi:hypothetical protein